MSQPALQHVSTSDGKFLLRKLGNVHEDSIPILFHEDVFEQIIEHSHQDLTRELGGFLLGDRFQADKEYIEVRNFLVANDARSEAASFTFTHDTWAAVNREVEEKFPDDKIVGWHHTHPGFGIFLSGYDMFIHRNFFTAPWHIALVVDPKAKEFGFFQWRQDEVVDCGFYFMYENPNDTE